MLVRPQHHATLAAGRPLVWSAGPGGSPGQTITGVPETTKHLLGVLGPSSLSQRARRNQRLPTSGVRRLARCASRIINLRPRCPTALPGWALGGSLPGPFHHASLSYVMTGVFASMRAPVSPSASLYLGAQKQDGADSETWRFASTRCSKCDILVSWCTHGASYSRHPPSLGLPVGTTSGSARVRRCPLVLRRTGGCHAVDGERGRRPLHAIRIDVSFDPAIVCSLPIPPRQILAPLVLCTMDGCRDAPWRPPSGFQSWCAALKICMGPLS